MNFIFDLLKGVKLWSFWQKGGKLSETDKGPEDDKVRVVVSPGYIEADPKVREKYGPLLDAINSGGLNH